MSFCPDCAIAKSTVADISRRSNRNHDPPQPFHSRALDIWGPTSVPDILGNRYVFGDVYYSITSIVAVLLPRKSDAPSAFVEILATISSFDHKPSRIRIDNDSVFFSV
jgi:hypothetical protein